MKWHTQEEAESWILGPRFCRMESTRSRRHVHRRSSDEGLVAGAAETSISKRSQTTIGEETEMERERRVASATASGRGQGNLTKPSNRLEVPVITFRTRFELSATSEPWN